MSKLLIYDLETTGLDPKENAIHQISGIIIIDGKIKENFNLRVAPHAGAVIEQKALDVGNVTEEQIMAYPPNILVHKELLKILKPYVNKYNKKDKFHLIGFNNSHFDNPFFRAFFKLCGDEYYGSWFWPDTPDVMCLASDYLRNERSEMKNFQLRTVAEYLGIKVEEEKLHDAVYDVYLTLEIYKIVAQKPRKI